MKKKEFLKRINNGFERGAKAKLAEKLGVARPSVIEWFNGRSKPSEQNVQKMAALFSIDEQELWDMFNGKYDEEETINSNTFLEEKEDVMFIPVLGISSATEEKFILEELESYLPIKKSAKKQFAVRVEGNCMVDPQDPQNSIYSGNYIIVDPEAVAVSGDVVLARIDSEYSTIKRFFPHDKEVRLIPDNPKCKTLVYKTNQVEIVGKVVNVYRPVKRKKERI